jgi:ankyrin repeat protein
MMHLSRVWLALAVVLAAGTGCRKRAATDLPTAAGRRDIAVVARFLDQGADPSRPNSIGRIPLFEAASKPNNAAVIKLLVQHGCKIDLPGRMSVLANADVTNMQCLIDAGADVNWPKAMSWSPLRVHVERGSDGRAIRVLLDHGADPNPPGDSLVLMAAKQRRGDVAKILLDAGTKLGDDKGGSALECAISMCDEELVRALLSHGADATRCDRYGNSLVMLAVRFKCAECIDALVSAGADPNRADNSGHTPYWEARYVDDMRLALVRNGAYRASPEEVLAERKRQADGGK